MKILFSAAMNFQMINRSRRVDSREYPKADDVINEQKTGTVKIGSAEKVHCQYVLKKNTDLITNPNGVTGASTLSHTQVCTHPFHSCPD